MIMARLRRSAKYFGLHPAGVVGGRVESSKTVGIRKDLIETAARRVKVDTSLPTSGLSAVKAYADGVPENRIFIFLIKGRRGTASAGCSVEA